MRLSLSVLCILLSFLLVACNDDTAQKQRDGQVEAKPLPYDICVVPGSGVMMPQITIAAYHYSDNEFFTYVNSDGDLVALLDGQPYSVYEGDFCR